MRNWIILVFAMTFAGCRFVHNQVNDVPSFNLLLSDSVTQFNTSQIRGGNPIALLYFSPDCSHCQKETESILQNMDSLKNVQFYFITNDSLKTMRMFENYYKMKQYSNIVIGRDCAYYFSGHFKSVAPPYLVIYDGTRKFRALLQGEMDAHNIITVVNKL